MVVNWDSIKYIVQIPLKWYREISDKVNHAYGSEFIDVRQDGNSGGLEIGIDEALFESKVKSILPEQPEGTVTSVDGHSPNENGEVSFGLSGSKWVKTDSDGHLTTTNDKVPSVSSTDNLVSDSLTVVTGVVWSNNQIQITKKTLVFKNGLLTAINNATGNNIATVTYTGT